MSQYSYWFESLFSFCVDILKATLLSSFIIDTKINTTVREEILFVYRFKMVALIVSVSSERRSISRLKFFQIISVNRKKERKKYGKEKGEGISWNEEERKKQIERTRIDVEKGEI